MQDRVIVVKEREFGDEDGEVEEKAVRGRFTKGEGTVIDTRSCYFWFCA